MKKFVLIIIFIISFNFLQSQEIVKIKLHDGETLTGKLDLPSNNDEIKTLVIFISGTGPNTYLNHRKIGNKEFNFYDLYINEFKKSGIAFFAYNQRGVDFGNNPPYYDSIDNKKYKTYLPSNCVKDIISIIDFLKTNQRLKNSKVILLGWSEGSIIAAMAADEYKNRKIIDALFLCGYVNDNLFDVIKWQKSGESSMIFFRKYFDKNNDKEISKDEFLSDDPALIQLRKNLGLEEDKDSNFIKMDVDSNNKLNANDFGIMLKSGYEALLKAIDNNDDNWIWNNYVRVTSLWFKEHFKLEANNKRLLRIDIPIYIFQGEEDQSSPVNGVLDIKNSFEKNNKKNLNCYIFKGADHDLNFTNYLYNNNIPEGIQKIFDTAKEIFK